MANLVNVPDEEEKLGRTARALLLPWRNVSVRNVLISKSFAITKNLL